MYKNQCKRNSGRSISCTRKKCFRVPPPHPHPSRIAKKWNWSRPKSQKPHLKNNYYSYLLTTACVSTQIPSFRNELPIKLHWKKKNPDYSTSLQKIQITWLHHPPLRNFPTTPRHSRNKLKCGLITTKKSDDKRQWEHVNNARETKLRRVSVCQIALSTGCRSSIAHVAFPPALLSCCKSSCQQNNTSHNNFTIHTYIHTKKEKKARNWILRSSSLGVQWSQPVLFWSCGTVAARSS